MKEIFDRWMALKFDIQSLASIVQNEDTTVNNSQYREWLQNCYALKAKIEQLQHDTIRAMKIV
jgi:hypothetical protein